jgi:hypothetical protein
MEIKPGAEVGLTFLSHLFPVPSRVSSPRKFAPLCLRVETFFPQFCLRLRFWFFVGDSFGEHL